MSSLPSPAFPITTCHIVCLVQTLLPPLPKLPRLACESNAMQLFYLLLLAVLFMTTSQLLWLGCQLQLSCVRCVRLGVPTEDKSREKGTTISVITLDLPLAQQHRSTLHRSRRRRERMSDSVRELLCRLFVQLHNRSLCHLFIFLFHSPIVCLNLPPLECFTCARKCCCTVAHWHHWRCRLQFG